MMDKVKSVTVQFTYEFELDAEHLDEAFVDINGLTRDEAFKNLKIDINNDLITPDDFVIVERGNRL